MFRFYQAIIILLLCCAFAADRQQAYPQILKDFIKDPAHARLIDFSYAGYRLGVSLPARQYTYKVFNVTDFGALPNDGQDDIAAIQRAIDAAAQNGGGVVQFPPGVFDFDVQTKQQFLHIRGSHIVLRGYGEGLDGTILHDHAGSDYPDKSRKWLAGMYPSFFHFSQLPSDSAWEPFTDQANLATAIQPARAGSLQIVVSNPNAVQVGQTYMLTQYSTDSSLTYALAYPVRRIGSNHFSQDANFKYKMRHLFTVVQKVGSRLTLDAPLLWDLHSGWNPTLWRVPVMLSEVGVENFRLRTDWHEPFVHHSSPTHDNGWDHVKFNFVQNGWIRNLVHEGTSAAVGLSNSKNCVVYDCQIIGNPGHNGFIFAGASTRNLFMNIKGGKQMHTYSFNGYASGNVFYNCFSEEPSAIDTHGGLGVHNLFDNIYGGVFKNGGSAANVPPGHGRGLVFWNWQMGVFDPYNGRVRQTICSFRLTPGIVAVGVRGLMGQDVHFENEKGKPITTDVSNEWAHIENLNQQVFPKSLYTFQRSRRLGSPLPLEEELER